MQRLKLDFNSSNRSRAEPAWLWHSHSVQINIKLISVINWSIDQVPFAELSSRVISGVLQTFRLVSRSLEVKFQIICCIINIVTIVFFTGLGGERLLPGSPGIFCQRRSSSRALWSVDYHHGDFYYDGNHGDNDACVDVDNDSDNGTYPIQMVKADLLTRRRIDTTTGELRWKFKSNQMKYKFSQWR